VGKVVGIDFLNGMPQIMTKILEIDHVKKTVKTKDWLILHPIPQQNSVQIVPYGFPFYSPVKSATIEADRIGLILTPEPNFVNKYNEATSPIKLAPDLANIDLSQFSKPLGS